MTHVTLPDERKKPKKGKKRKANDEDSEAAVPESDVVTPQKDETNTLTDKGRAKKKAKKKKKKSQAEDSEAAVPESDVVTPQKDETNTLTDKGRAKKKAKKKKKKSQAESSEEVNTSQQEEPPGAEDENGSDGEKDLSPEEKRVLERKLKKIRKKEEKKKLREEGKSIKKDEVQTSVSEKAALEYLTCWSERREEWKFLKSRQTWLLKHMYDTTKVTDDHFKVLLAYIENIRGASRDTTLQKAEAIMRWEGQGEDADTKDAENKKHRAKQVVQLL